MLELFSDPPADIEAREVAVPSGPIAIPKSVAPVNRFDASAFFDKELRFAAVWPNMRLPTKPRQLPTSTPTLPNVFRQRHHVAITVFEVFLPRTISS